MPCLKGAFISPSWKTGMQQKLLLMLIHRAGFSTLVLETDYLFKAGTAAGAGGGAAFAFIFTCNYQVIDKLCSPRSNVLRTAVCKPRNSIFHPVLHRPYIMNRFEWGESEQKLHSSCHPQLPITAQSQRLRIQPFLVLPPAR